MEFISRNPELAAVTKQLIRYGLNRGIIQITYRKEISDSGCEGLCATISGVDLYITNNIHQSVEEYQKTHDTEAQVSDLFDAIMYCRDEDERTMYLTTLLLAFIEETKTYGKNGLKIEEEKGETDETKHN